MSQFYPQNSYTELYKTLLKTNTSRVYELSSFLDHIFLVLLPYVFIYLVSLFLWLSLPIFHKSLCVCVCVCVCVCERERDRDRDRDRDREAFHTIVHKIKCIR